MTFLAPLMLFVLALIPALALGYLRAQRRRFRYPLRYSSLDIVRASIPRSARRRHIPAALFLLCLTVLIFALARPALVATIPTDEGTVILAIDVSASMWASDMEPNRMEAAKNAALGFVQQLPANLRVGIVSFSTEARLVQPPGAQREIVMESIAKLYPKSGTAIGSALLASLDAIRDHSATGEHLVEKGTFVPAVIVLLTDGENTDGPSPLEVAPVAAERGVRVYTIGIGSADINVARAKGGIITNVLDEETLKTIAQTTSANYYSASTESDLTSVYETVRTHLVFRTEPRELTPLFLALAIVFAFTATLTAFTWLNHLP